MEYNTMIWTCITESDLEFVTQPYIGRSVMIHVAT